MIRKETIVLPPTKAPVKKRALPTAPIPEKPHADRGPGRPKIGDRVIITIKLDRDIVEHFRSGGPGWQARLNETLRLAINLGGAGPRQKGGKAL